MFPSGIKSFVSVLEKMSSIKSFFIIILKANRDNFMDLELMFCVHALRTESTFKEIVNLEAEDFPV